MGSMIHLAVGRLEIDWGKNHGFADHSGLFQPADVADVPYHYVDDDGVHFSELKEGMAKPLSQVVDRIELLGHTMAVCEAEFRYLSGLNCFDAVACSFDMLRSALAEVDVSSLSADYDESDDFGKFFRRQIAPRLGLAGLPPDELHAFGEGMENLTPHSVLRLLAFNPSARDLPVTWAFKDLEDNGWARRTDFARPLDRSRRFLIVTEGSSDAAILRHALRLLMPHVEDFFEFVDMDEGYPFAGTGNLSKFVQGLVSIGILNNVVVLFDNDAEGGYNHERCLRLNLPGNMRVLRLPDLPEFLDFETEGPEGRGRADVNGRAVAIESYLDFHDAPRVRWTSFKEAMRTYQGELVGKDTYKRRFLDQRFRQQGYDYGKIEAVLRMIIANCVAMRETEELRTLAVEFGDN